MFRFSLKNYRAVHSAEIKIDGITVLAGINGSGKSTISRWLYYLVNAAHEFEKFQKSYFIDSIVEEVEKMQRLFRTSTKYSTYLSIRRQLYQQVDIEDTDCTLLHNVYQSFIRKAAEDLSEYAAEQDLTGRIATFLLNEPPSEMTESDQVIDAFVRECNDAYAQGFTAYSQATESYKRKDLDQVIKSGFSNGESLPDSAQLFEDKMPLLNHTVFIPSLLLSRAIYIDSPMAVFGSEYNESGGIWERFNSLMYTENPEKSETNFNHFKALIQSVVGGSFKEEDDELGFEKELHFVSKEQGIDINISEAATGIKSFAYLSRLIENGWLGKETLLLIDEPEAHLHPQWIVEFARLLVLIYKELNVKIVIASHNPDMVSAIQAIADKEGVIDNTVFYLAEKDAESARYEFVEKGSDISDIFTSFNIALSRITVYGNQVG